MSAVVVIPVKSFDRGYGRLAGALDETGRANLGSAVAARVASVVADAGGIPLVVTGEPAVALWATNNGFPSIPEHGDGLNAAIESGVAWASGSNSRWIALHADLPLIDVHDIRALMDVERDLIAPSADGGTSALSASDPLLFQYGPASFHRHLVQLNNPVVITRTGLLHDIDAPADLHAALNHPRGAWLRQALA